MRRRNLFALPALLFLYSCGIVEIGDDQEGNAGGVWGGPAGGSGGTVRSTCYITAVDYQKGYDWRSDQARESVRCSLVVFADGVPVMKVPVGDTYEVGSDPDMHRMIKGDLYTDYSTDSETVIKKNGDALFRYQGRETMCGITVAADGVYTLGQSRDGDGFSFRKNGEILLQRETGVVLRNLEYDGDSLYFAFYETILNASGGVGRYYCAVNGKVRQVAVRDDVRTVWDVVIRNGRVIYVASLVGAQYPVLCTEGRMTYLQIPTGATLLSCRLFWVGDGLGAEGIFKNADGEIHNALWLEGYLLSSFPKQNVVSALDVYANGIFCAVNPVEPSGQGLIYRGGEQYDMPQGYAVMGNNAIDVVDGILHVGLSSFDGQKPIVWRDGQIDSLKVNGYISAIYADSVR